MDSQIPTVGVAMIARDCAETIARALCSVRTIARQIVVLDTGSHDRTPTVAARLGAEVYFHPWRNDFSDARNLALDYLRTDWVLVLDSDEELDGESFRAHCPNLADPMIGGVELTIVSALEGGITTAEHRYTRLFRRHRDIRFEGAIHEQIAASIQRAGFEIARSQVRILHYGYQTVQPEKLSGTLHSSTQSWSVSPTVPGSATISGWRTLLLASSTVLLHCLLRSVHALSFPLSRGNLPAFAQHNVRWRRIGCSRRNSSWRCRATIATTKACGDLLWRVFLQPGGSSPVHSKH